MTTRLRLFLVWFGGYGICFVMVLVFYMLGYTVLDRIPDNLGSLTGIFAPYLTPIIAFWYTKDHVDQARESSAGGFRVAFASSIFFNLIMIFLLSSVFFRDGEGLIERTLETSQGAGTLLAFLVGPAIGYFFGKGEG